jgi:hypothetical protein
MVRSKESVEGTGRRNRSQDSIKQGKTVIYSLLLFQSLY